MDTGVWKTRGQLSEELLADNHLLDNNAAQQFSPHSGPASDIIMG